MGTLYTRIELDLSRRIENYNALRDGQNDRNAPIEFLAVAKSIMVQCNTGKILMGFEIHLEKVYEKVISLNYNFI